MGSSRRQLSPPKADPKPRTFISEWRKILSGLPGK
jgi:hypothetical protein